MSQSSPSSLAATSISGGHNIDRVGVGAFTVHPLAVGPAYLPGHNSYVMASEKGHLWEVTGVG